MTTTTIDRTGVERAMQAAGYSQYTQYAGELASHLQRGQVTAESVQSYARQRGLSVSYQQAQTFCNTLLGSGTEAEVGGRSPNNPDGFDRTAAAEIIREAGREAGVNMANLEEVLVEAGLVDAEDEHPSWARGIVDRLDRLEGIARSRGLM